MTDKTREERIKQLCAANPMIAKAEQVFNDLINDPKVIAEYIEYLKAEEAEVRREGAPNLVGASQIGKGSSEPIL